MGARDSLVFEYLINPAEEFVQIKNRDDLVYLETKNDKLNSSKESTAIEISNKIEALKERAGEEGIEGNPVVDVDVSSDINEVLSPELNIEKDSKIIDSKVKDIVIVKANTDGTITTETTKDKSNEEVNNNQSTTDANNNQLKSAASDIVDKGEETITNSNVDVQKKIPEVELENKDVTSIEETIETAGANKNNIPLENTTTQSAETKSDDIVVSVKETADSLSIQVTTALELHETTTNNPADSILIGPIQKDNVADFEVENTNSSIKNTRPLIDSSTVSITDEDGLSKSKESTMPSNSNVTERETNIEVSNNEEEKPTDLISENKIEEGSTPVNASIDAPAPSKDIEASNPINQTDKDVPTSEQGANDIKDIEVSPEGLPNTIKTKPESLKENKKNDLVRNRDFKRIEKSWTTFSQPQTLFYQDRQDLTRGENMVKLNQMIVSEYETNTTFALLAHTDDTELGLPEYVQYNTFKRALKIAEYLNASGIDKNRIRIESLANNYPLIKSDIAGEKVNSLYAHNKRVDILIYNNDQIKEDNVNKDSSIPDYAFDRRYELFRSIREGTYYSIEVASSKRIFKNAILRLYNDIYIRRDNLDAENKYYIGIYTQKEDADKVRGQLLETSSPYAKVVKFVNGQIDYE